MADSAEITTDIPNINNKLLQSAGNILVIAVNDRILYPLIETKHNIRYANAGNINVKTVFEIITEQQDAIFARKPAINPKWIENKMQYSNTCPSFKR